MRAIYLRSILHNGKFDFCLAFCLWVKCKYNLIVCIVSLMRDIRESKCSDNQYGQNVSYVCYIVFIFLFSSAIQIWHLKYSNKNTSVCLFKHVCIHLHMDSSVIVSQRFSRIIWLCETICFCCFSGHSVRLLGQKKDGGRRLGGARLDLPKIRKNPLIEIISINTG